MSDMVPCQCCGGNVNRENGVHILGVGYYHDSCPLPKEYRRVEYPKPLSQEKQDEEKR